MDYLFKAIKFLKPDSEFSYENEDYSTINWNKLSGKAPTQNEIDAAIEKIKALEIEEKIDKENKKTALLEKLGISEEEAQLLIS